MIKIKVHIYSHSAEFLDENLHVEIMLPAVPRVGELVHLNEAIDEELSRRAKRTLDIANDYCLYFSKEFTNKDEIEEKDLPVVEFDFIQCQYVTSVVYHPNTDFVTIELAGWENAEGR